MFFTVSKLFQSINKANKIICFTGAFGGALRLDEEWECFERGRSQRHGDLRSLQSWDQWQKNSKHVLLLVRTLLNRK